MRTYFHRLSAEDDALAVDGGTKMTADQRHPGRATHHYEFEHLEWLRKHQAIMLVEAEALGPASGQQLLDVAGLVLETGEFVLVDLLTFLSRCRQATQQDAGAICRAYRRTHDHRQV